MISTVLGPVKWEPTGNGSGRNGTEPLEGGAARAQAIGASIFESQTRRIADNVR